jgi:hypothetical protein
MSNGSHVGFCFGFIYDLDEFYFGFTFNANNLVWSINGCDIFIDFVGSGQLFVDFSYVFTNVFLKLDALVCSPNLFGQYFDPYISLGLEQYGIPPSSCSTNDVSVHPSTFSVFLCIWFHYMSYFCYYVLYIKLSNDS